MDLQVRKLKEEIYAIPRKKSVTGPYHLSQSREDSLFIPTSKGED